MEQISTLLTRYPWLNTLIDRGLRVILIIAVVLVCAKLIHLISLQILAFAKKAHRENGHGREREKRIETVVKLVDTSLRVILFGAAILMGLRELGLDITPLLTGAGIAGVALGFGAQSLVKDTIAGFFLLVEDQIRIGDVIKLNNLLSGTVERMELRVIAIRDGDGTLHIVPNGEIKSVSNMTYDFACAVVDLPFTYQVDLKRLSEVLEKVACEFEEDPKWKMQLRSRVEVLGVTKFEHTHMTVEISAKTEPHSKWSVARELRKRVKFALDEAGVEQVRA
ncbi:MAG: mechanosensitive ion channel family protein [Bdellovibrionota bacterium]